MRDGLPVLAITTSRTKTARGGARYRILGLATIEDFVKARQVFQLRGCTEAVVEGLRAVARGNELDEVYLRDRLVLPFSLAEPRPRVSVDRGARDRAFRAIVL